MKMLWLRPALCGSAMLLLLGTVAEARTFISGSGNDGNTSQGCSKTSPCRTLSAAYSITAAGSEIIALDAGGYGSVTISHAISLIGISGATISAPSGGSGLTISGAGTVTVRNFEINGSNAANTTGITITNGTLNIFDSVFRNLTVGLVANSSHVMSVNSHYTTNGTAIKTTGAGVDLGTFPQTGASWVLLYGGTVTFNTTAFFQTDPGANKNPILTASIGNGSTTFIAGNTTFSTGSGSSCASACTAISIINQQTNQNLN